MSVELETTSLVIQMADPRALKPHPEALLVPMSKEEENALRDDIAENGIMHAIDVSSDGNVLDGVHRWKYAIELGIAKVPAVIYSYKDPDEETAHAIRANFKRRHLTEGQRGILGMRLLPIEKRLAERRMSRGGTESASARDRDEYGKLLPSEQSKVLPIGSTLDESKEIPSQAEEEKPKQGKEPKPKKSKKERKPDQGEAIEKVAKVAGVSPRTMYRVQAVANDPELLNAVEEGSISVNKAYDQVKKGKQAKEVKDAADSGRKLTDLEIMQTLGITVQSYDLWNFSECDDRFGHDYPGRIPGQIVAQCLYYWTAQEDLVLDPMAGSGTTIDVCKILNRHALAYDAHPCREDITLHNLATQGWPKETKDAKLIFWDPPYFKKKDDGYGDQSISRFDRSEYLAFFGQMTETIPDDFHGFLAFLMSPYRDFSNPLDSIWMHDYTALFLEHGWYVHDILNVPLSTQRVPPQRVKQCRDSKSLIWLMRDLVIFGRK